MIRPGSGAERHATMVDPHTAPRAEKHPPSDLEAELIRCFLAKPRSIPQRPSATHVSTLVIRKELLPFYFAIYDHDLGRFTALQYHTDPDAPLCSVALQPHEQPSK